MKNYGLHNIRCILFDLDGTLYPSEKIYAIGIKNAWNCFKKFRFISSKNFKKAYKKAREEVKINLNRSTSARNRVLYFKRMTENILGRSNAKLTLTLVQAYDRCWEKIDPANAQWVFKKLKNRCQIGIVTNQVCLTQLQKISKMDPESRWVDVIVTSEEVNAEKPKAKIFLEACRRLNLSPKECMVVGDDWQHDILGAFKLGFHPVFLGRAKKRVPKNIPVIRNIRAIVSLLNSIKK